MKTLITDNILSTFGSIIHHKALLLFSFSLTPFISWITESLKIEFLGFSLGILAFLTILIIFDFITGVSAAKYKGEKLSSRKGLRSVDKLISYFMFICFTALLQNLLADKEYILGIWLISNFKILVFSSIFLWEFHSIGENLEKRYGSKPRIFTVLDVITKILEKKIIAKIEGSDSTSTVDERINDIESLNDDTHVK